MTDVAVRPQSRDLHRQVLAIVAELAAERHDFTPPVRVTLNMSLEHDLGLFSLERVELTHRLEQSAGVAIDGAALAEACTVGELVGLASGEKPARRPPPVFAASTTPAQASSLRSMPFTIRVAVLLAAVGIGLRLRLLARPQPIKARRALRWGARWLLRAAGAVPSIHGIENLDGQLPAVLVANHQSYVDTAVLLAALPVDALLIANERLRDAPLLGVAIRAAGYLVVDRTTAAGRARGASDMARALGEGQTLLVFPEGTIEQGPGLGRFRLGAFAAAARAGRPVIPLTVEGTRDVLPLGRWTLARRALRVTVHPPVVPTASGWPETVRLARHARQVMEGSLTEAASGALGVHDRGKPHQRA